jgi:hypothetical protein
MRHLHPVTIAASRWRTSRAVDRIVAMDVERICRFYADKPAAATAEKAPAEGRAAPGK